MKKKLFIDLLLVVLSGLIFVSFRQNEQRNNESRLNRNGLSVNSLIVSGAKNQSVETVIQKLAKHSVTDFQLQLVSRKDANLSYVYAKGKTRYTLPLTSGRTFNENDYRSEVPFVILGSDLSKEAYQPQSQMYYHLRETYLAVIGVTGDKTDSAINHHLFISLSPNQTDLGSLRTADFRIIYDPTTPQKHDTKSILRLFNAHSTKRLVDTSTVKRERQGWFERSGMILTHVILIMVLMIILAWILGYLIIYSTKNFQMRPFFKNQLSISMVGQYATHLVLATGIGWLIGWRVQSIEQPAVISWLLVGFDVFATLVIYLYLSYSKHYEHLRAVIKKKD